MSKNKRRVVNFIEEGKLGGPQTRIVRVAASISSEVETIVVMPSENSEDFQKLCANSNISYQTIKISRITKELSILRGNPLCIEKIIITPGIRPANSTVDDQKRVATPNDAFKMGASYLVIGRPIYQAKDPLSAYEAIKAQILNN